MVDSPNQFQLLKKLRFIISRSNIPLSYTADIQQPYTPDQLQSRIRSQNNSHQSQAFQQSGFDNRKRMQNMYSRSHKHRSLKKSLRRNPYYNFPTEPSSMQNEATATSTLYDPTLLTKQRTITLSQTKSILNESINKYRDVITSSNSRSMLPFLDSLRSTTNARVTKMPTPIDSNSSLLQPVCSSKNTSGPQRRISDFHNSNRIAEIDQLWTQNKGRFTKDAVEFGCSLRRYSYEGSRRLSTIEDPRGRESPSKSSQAQLLAPPFNYLNTKIDTLSRDRVFFDVPQLSQQNLNCPRLRKAIKLKTII